MKFEYLDKESEKLLEKINSANLSDNISGTSIQFLVEHGYVDGLDATTLSESKPLYIVRGTTQKGKTYFEMKELYENDRKATNKKEILLVIFGAILGFILSNISSIIDFFMRFLEGV